MRRFWIISFAILLAACEPTIAGPTVTPTAALTPPPTATPRATPTPSPPTVTPTATLPPFVCDVLPEPLPVPPRSAPLEVYWLSDRNIWLWDETTGQSRQVSDTGDVLTFSVSDDGRVIAFRRSGDPWYSQKPHEEEIWAVDRDGTRLRKLLGREQLAAMGSVTHPEYAGNLVDFIGWEPGTHRLTFSVTPHFQAIGGDDTPFGYWAIDADSGVLAQSAPPAELPQWWRRRSPDGKWEYVVGDEGLSLCPTDGSPCRENVITYPSGPYEGEGGWYGPSLAWSPDSRTLKAVFPAPGYPWTADIWKLVAYTIPVDAGAPIQSAEFEASPYEFFISPDHRYLLFWKPVKPRSNSRELHLATFDGSQHQIYAVGAPMIIDGWAPDSMHFVYERRDGTWLGVVCGEPVLLADVPYASSVTWVDGQHFLFVSRGTSDPNTLEGELRLGTVGGASILLGPYNRAEGYASGYYIYRTGQSTN